MKIDSINMKSVSDDETYYRMWVKASELPEWMYLKAKEMDDDCGYIGPRDTQCFELEGCIPNGDSHVYDLRLVYYFDDYETITELTDDYHSDIYDAFEEFAQKYGNRMPDNGELLLGDGEYEDAIPDDLWEEWGKPERKDLER